MASTAQGPVAPSGAGKMPAGVVWTLAIMVQLALLWLTIPVLVPDLGVPTWHHNASLGVAVLFTALLWKPITQDRRFLGVGVLVTTFLALASGFLILYLKQDLKATGYKDWAKWWHVLWSWFSIAFFLGHSWINRAPLVRSLKRFASGVRGALRYVIPLVLILVAIPLTWSDWGADNLQEEQYLPLTLYTWLVLLLPTYGAWLWVAIRRRVAERPAWGSRPAAQAVTDSWLFPMTILANVSGFPILYFGTKDTVLKYVAKYWHTWPSIAMAILVFAHSVQFWPSMMQHLRAARSAKAAASRGA